MFVFKPQLPQQMPVNPSLSSPPKTFLSFPTLPSPFSYLSPFTNYSNNDRGGNLLDIGHFGFLLSPVLQSGIAHEFVNVLSHVVGLS